MVVDISLTVGQIVQIYCWILSISFFVGLLVSTLFEVGITRPAKTDDNDEEDLVLSLSRLEKSLVVSLSNLRRREEHLNDKRQGRDRLAYLLEQMLKGKRESHSTMAGVAKEYCRFVDQCHNVEVDFDIARKMCDRKKVELDEAQEEFRVAMELQKSTIHSSKICV